MKFYYILIIGLLISVGVNAQTLIKQEDVPSTIVKRFDKKFKGAEKVKWFKVNKVNYLVKFMVKEYEGEANIDKDGVMTKSKMQIDLRTLHH
jgi:hypothetical protein